jgi:NAD(P)-dependent dehydrogenase (short-subunit alcohol dehydrogenase family)
VPAPGAYTSSAVVPTGVSHNRMLADKSILITGAAGAIGRATATAAAGAGAKVYLADLREPELARLVEFLGEGHFYSRVDVRDPASIERLCFDAVDKMGPLDGVAHVAGIIIRKPEIEAITEADWDMQVDVNLKGTFFLNRALGTRMARESSIVNFSSIAWWTGGNRGSMVYAATKAGVVSLTRSFARAYAPLGIRVNAIAPGVVETPMITEGMTRADAEAYRQDIPLGRMAKPSELGNAVVFLLSNLSSYIAGAVLNVSGGRLLY